CAREGGKRVRRFRYASSGGAETAFDARGKEFMWRNHDWDRTLVERITIRTGGAYTLFTAHFFGFPWRGYILQVQVPDGMAKPHKWRLRLRNTDELPKKFNLYYPEQLTPCGPPAHGTLAGAR